MNTHVKLAYTIECFLNAARLSNSPQRTKAESQIVHVFIKHQKTGMYAIYNKRRVELYKKDTKQCLQTLDVPDATCDALIWTDGQTLSALDQKAYSSSGALVMLGVGALALSMPGITQARSKDSGSGSTSSNNNNNNNNNNNG